MFNKPIALIFIFVLSNALSGILGYEWYRYRQEAQLKAFLGVNQEAHAAVSSDAFFDKTDSRVKPGK